jgi:uncharacterized protein YbjT (DUF2867 family)
MAFVDTSTRNLLAAETVAGVRHHVALSVVGADLMPDSGFMRAKVAQEALMRSGGVPFTIVRATQFHEFVAAIAESGVAKDGTIHLPHANMQPIAADDVAAALAKIAVSPPANGLIELAGPDVIPMDDLARRWLNAAGDARRVIADASAKYFGTPVDDRTLVPGGARPILGSTRFDGWAQLAAKNADRAMAPSR